MAALIALLWAGLILGVSFLATPAKFLAPSLSLAGALEIGHVTFSVLAKVEVLFLLALIASFWPLRGSTFALTSLIIVLLCLAVQNFALMPELNVRTQAVIAGQDVPPSSLHKFFIAIEILKVCALICIGVIASRLGVDSPTTTSL